MFYAATTDYKRLVIYNAETGIWVMILKTRKSMIEGLVSRSW
jgi:hypothetical protein